MFDLTTIEYRLFQTVLHEYQSSTRTGGYSDTITLFFLRDGLNDAPIDMSEKSFERGLKNSMKKRIYTPKFQINIG